LDVKTASAVKTKSPNKAKGKSGGQPKSVEQMTPAESGESGGGALLSRAELAQLAKSVDPNETLEEDVTSTGMPHRVHTQSHNE